MNPPPERLAAALADRYRLERELGQGGMATVYLAADLKHDRNVAIKVLKPELAAVLGAERFVQEIKTTAALSHPHILPLFDSGVADGFLYYVMPFIEGETIRDRLNRETQLGIEDAVKITAEVADALDYAHRHGVIHRDIKPENILLHDARPMVMDFGIALAVSAAAGGRMTETGLSLGTPHYMSPEQATADKTITARSDIYSLASVLYEMLAGQPPHLGGSAQQIIMKIIAEPVANVTSLRKAVPPNVAAAVAKALEKLPADRFGSAKEFAAALADAGFRTETGISAASMAAVPPWRRTAVLASACVALAAVALWGWLRPRPAPAAAARRAQIVAPGPLDRALPMLSFDGSRIAWIVLTPDAPLDARPGSSQSRIMVRRRDAVGLEPVTGTEGAWGLEFSPDGRSIAFGTHDTVKVLTLDGGRPLSVLNDRTVNDVAWGDDGYLYVSSNSTDRRYLLRVPATGGQAEKVAGTDTAGFYLRVRALPGSRGLFAVAYRDAFDVSLLELRVVDLSTGTFKPLGYAVDAAYLPSGHLLTLSASGQLSARRFDAERLEATGPPVVLDEGVVSMSVSAEGDLVYAHGTPDRLVPELRWFGRDGSSAILDSIATPGYIHTDPTISPDGRKVAYFMPQTDTSGTVVVKELAGGTNSRIYTDSAGSGVRIAWSRDGAYVGFLEHRRDGQERLVRRRADGSGAVEPVTAWTPGSDMDIGYGWLDGTTIVTGASYGLTAFTPGRDTAWVRLLDVGQRYENPTISPDGHWVAYVASVDGQPRIFVRPFPAVDSGIIPVSEGEGFEPRWSPDGRSLYYVRTRFGALELVEASVRPGSGFAVIARRLLFDIQSGYVNLGGGWEYDIDPTGKRFLARRRRVERQHVDGFWQVTNLIGELRQKVGGGR